MAGVAALGDRPRDELQCPLSILSGAPRVRPLGAGWLPGVIGGAALQHTGTGARPTDSSTPSCIQPVLKRAKYGTGRDDKVSRDKVELIVM